MTKSFTHYNSIYCQKSKVLTLRDMLGESGWISSFWNDIGLSEFVEDKFQRLGRIYIHLLMIIVFLEDFNT